MSKSNIGLVGLAVMGENLCLNMESKGFSVSVYNRTPDKTTAFTSGRAAGKNITGYSDLADFVASLESPRKVLLMVKAGAPVDGFIDQLLPLLDKGDIIIDGGNSHYPDSDRRTRYLETQGIHFIGSGVSGGEEGALLGPSIMPGGASEAWPHVRDIFKAIAAVVDGEPCCDWIGPEGAGHFVKMVHNGIEYGDMQLICEAYHLLQTAGYTTDDIQAIFAQWNTGVLDSYLIEITAHILAHKDTDGEPLVDKILDTAGQKGTGKWTSVAALDVGSPLTLISESVFSRILSSMKDERVAASQHLSGPTPSFTGDKVAFAKSIEQALYASKIVSYAQGYDLMKKVSEARGWHLNFGQIAMMWRGGCIIRSVFLNNIKAAYEKDPNLANLLLAPFFAEAVQQAQVDWRSVVAHAAVNGVPVPAFSSALAYFDAYRSARLPANLLQAQRDYFGAHTYERVDKPRGEHFHTNWTGRGGDTASTTYTV